tara:strand:+ start:529 stop:750 length:222 start_codon:yes stop_codon:yes gene_type:complete
VFFIAHIYFLLIRWNFVKKECPIFGMIFNIFTHPPLPAEFYGGQSISAFSARYSATTTAPGQAKEQIASSIPP